MPRKKTIMFNLIFLIMSNLNEFKVEELEQRLEMGKWTASADIKASCTGHDCKGTATVGISRTF